MTLDDGRGNRKEGRTAWTGINRYSCTMPGSNTVAVQAFKIYSGIFIYLTLEERINGKSSG